MVTYTSPFLTFIRGHNVPKRITDYAIKSILIGSHAYTGTSEEKYLVVTLFRRS